MIRPCLGLTFRWDQLFSLCIWKLLTVVSNHFLNRRKKTNFILLLNLNMIK